LPRPWRDSKATAGHAHPTVEGEHGFSISFAAAVFGDEEEALREGLRRSRWTPTLPGGATGRRSPGSWPTFVPALTLDGTCLLFEPVEELEKRGVLSWSRAERLALAGTGTRPSSGLGDVLSGPR
jgi:hypothetical protein